MSIQQIPTTFEQMMALFRQDRERSQKDWEELRAMSRETDRIVQELGRLQKKTEKKISDLGSRVGEIIEKMVGGRGRIIEKFKALGYEDIDSFYENRKFGSRRLGTEGQVDLVLENGDVAILIEVKTTLETADVRKHIERMEKYRRWMDAKGKGDDIRFVGAIAGAVVKGDAEEFAHENGIYVIVQSGKAVEIVPTPEGFLAKEW
jgi:protein involved in temperature-dependent protein secretion